MTLTDATRTVDSLKSAADRAMMGGDPRAAIPWFQQAVALAPDRLDMWIGLAACHRVLGDPMASLTALEGALTADPRCFPALLMKGSVLESIDQKIPAAMTYGNAILFTPPDSEMSEPTRRAVARAREVHGRYTDDLVAAMRSEAGLVGGPARSSDARRLETFIEAMAGRRKVYHSEPVKFHYPALPSIEFWDREEFPWLEALEARTDDIRREALAVWSEGNPELVPYVDYPDSLPLDQWAELNRSLEWSVYHLVKDGEPVAAHAAACPATMEALSLLGQPHVPRRSPVALYSILRPHTRIPPHNGVTNTRLLVHLPLIIPENCAFRVGGETRPWREGEAWVFDDSIEHEAWNGSDKPRAIMICDVWNPRVPPAEREMICRLMAALDRFNGDIPSGEF